MTAQSLTNEILAAVRLSRLPGVGANRFAVLVHRYDRPSVALAQVQREIAPLLPHPGKAPMDQGIAAVEAYLGQGGRGTYWGAPDYPRLLAPMPEPPPYLFYRGPLWPLPVLAVAIVGTRDASRAGRAFAEKLAADLAAQGVMIVSGGAIGIDTAAHDGALNADGRTALVTATGIDVCYPPRHDALFARVAERGCVLTELLPGTPPRRDFFPTRNRVLVGLAQALVVIEGRPRSGTHSSVHHMQKLRRPIFAWTGARGPRAELNRELFDHGGWPLGNAPAKQILDSLLKSKAG